MTKRFLALAFTALSILICPSLQAQHTKILAQGVVTDENGQAMIGASVMIVGQSIGVSTDLDGNYSIEVPAEAVLEFSCIGYQSQKLQARERLDVRLLPDNTYLESVVVVGYGTQKRGSTTGAVVGINGDNMLKTKNENPQNMLTGRVPGVRVWQKSAEPGTYSNSLDIRGLGEPLVVIDGVPRSSEDFQRMNPSDIENVSVLKDASAAIYGVRGGNGVILITTKKGSEGKTKVQWNSSYTFQVPSTMPQLASAAEAMILYNEMSMNRADGSGTLTYSQAEIDAYLNGSKRAADWNSLVFSNWSPQTQHDLSITGGNEKSQYYISLGYIYQEGFFRSRDLNYNKYNLRSNVSSQIADGLNFNLNISGFLDNRNTPDTGAIELIRNLWKQGVLYPAYADEAQELLSYEGLDLMQNTVAMMTKEVSGYQEFNKRQLQISSSLEYDFGTISKTLHGLTLKLLASYDYQNDFNEFFRKSYKLFAKDVISGEYTPKAFPDHEDRLTKEYYEKQQLLAQVLINYKRKFADKHDVGLTLGYETQKRDGDNFYALGDLAFSSPYLTALKDNTVSTFLGINKSNGAFYELAYKAFIGRLNYGFDDRYLVEAQFRYDASSKFAPGHQWGFFPSVSAAWRISQEPFFKDASALSFIDQLKIRASYGSLGDDSGLNYEWISGYKYPAEGVNSINGYNNNYAPGYVINDEFVFGVDTYPLPNTNITWLTSKTFNIGLDFQAWKGLLGISFDYFERSREGVFGQKNSALPTVVGASAPVENLNSDRNIGLELELSHRNRIGEINYSLVGIMTVTRKQNLLAYGQGPYGNSYDRWRHDNLTNRYQGVQFGYEAAGRYENWQDIWADPIYKDNDVLPGDYKYLDWNGDGEINSLDQHPYAFDQTPWMNYSLAFSLDWRNFDFSMLWQGTAMGSYMYDEPLYSIWGHNGGGALDIFLDRWHPEGQYTDVYDQNLKWIPGHYAFTGHSPHKDSQFNRVSTAYLRLKSIEIGYNLKFGKQANLRVYANAYNPLTITGIKYVDPEHPDTDYGRMYPLNKTFTAGFQLQF